jgi:uncharacterized protein YdcH (DUF465 family)
LITETIQIKKPLTELQKLELLADISKSDDRIKDLENGIDEMKADIKPLKEAQERERDNISQALANYKCGFIMENYECSVVYDKGMATYYDIKNGEKVDERPLTESEQLGLTENRIDAEKIIREASAVE